MLQFLVDEGAHTEWEEEQFHRTPLRLLQQHGSLQLQKPDIEGSVVRSVQVQIAGPIFHEDLVDAWEDWLEESDFTDVHRAVLTHRTRDVCLKDRLVGTPVADINVVQTLLDCGADVHKGYPLHRAAFWGDVQALKYLVHAGADICLQDDRGRTPLHEAAYYGKAEYVEELVRMGADILGLDILAQYGDTILDEARAGRKYFDAMSRLTYGHDEVVRVLSNLQAWRDSRSTLRHSREPVTEVEVLEDLKMPGSFPAG
ncbi:hypothetical protein EW026_g4782 [Hermanssonia centrifuga]|uniref:Uncharacterized protein n=1 Tax=Hermanssonia centrifuga TaxID=98765 RepID=A0A4S4KHV7_9APHY|nr:hypothetical protein EW026_g4782 [Hermanssonia centrifuga]